MKATIGSVYAICDHTEDTLHKPSLAPILKQTTGVTRTQLRKWVKQGRLWEYVISMPNGQRVLAYSRPREDSSITLGNNQVISLETRQWIDEQMSKKVQQLRKAEATKIEEWVPNMLDIGSDFEVVKE